MAGKKVEAVDKKADKALKDAKEAQEEAIVATGLARANRDSLKTLGDQMNKRLDDLFSLVEKALNGRK